MRRKKKGEGGKSIKKRGGACAKGKRLIAQRVVYGSTEGQKQDTSPMKTERRKKAVSFPGIPLRKKRKDAQPFLL